MNIFEDSQKEAPKVETKKIVSENKKTIGNKVIFAMKIYKKISLLWGLIKNIFIIYLLYKTLF
jgi:hypothetical protein